MIKFSWYQWLNTTRPSGTRNKARAAAAVQSLQIEGLESRTLLTANLPVAVADPSYVVNEDGLLTGTSVLANDTDADSGDVIDGAVLQFGTTHGSLTLNPNGTFLYAPNPNFNGVDSFTYFARDTAHNETGTVAATVTITVNAVPDAPIANAAQVSTAEDTPIGGTLTGSDADGDGLTFSAGATGAAHGLVVINSNGTFSYTPNANYFGTDTFTFKVNDGTFNSADATVTVTISSVNDIPIANSQSITLNEDTPFNGTLTGSDVESGSLLYSQGSVLAAHGVVVINPNGSFSYTPSANYNGPDSFTFRANDGTAYSNEATVTVTVSSINDVPVAMPLNVTTNEDTVYNGTLVGTDAEGSSLVYSAGATSAAHGTVTINPGGTFSYTPYANYFGADSFSYKVNDGTFNSPDALVTITVSAVNDIPVASSSSAATNEDIAVGGFLNATDADGNGLTFAAGSVTPTHGSVIVTTNGVYIYTPAANYFGTDTFTFVANDGTSNSPEATVTITVAAVNDAPVANASAITVVANTPFNGTLTGSDVDGNSLTYLPGSVAPAHGTVSIASNGTFIYTPAANYNGSDSFTFKVNDGLANSAEATVSVTVGAPNNAPTVVNGSASVTMNGVLNGSVSTLGADVDGNPLTYSVVTAPTHGVLVLSPDGTFVYTPTGNYTGADFFTFKANDGQALSNTGTFSITVNPANVPLTLTLPSSNPQVSRNSVRVQLDPAATLIDPDTLINFNGAKITVSIANLPSDDAKNGRVTLTVNNQGSGSGLVKVKSGKIYFNGSTSSIGSVSGGGKGNPLVITFNSGASEVAVNAVLRQITIQASKKATTGNLAINYQAIAGGQTALSNKTATIV